MTMPLVWQLGCQDLEGRRWGDGFFQPWVLGMHMDEFGCVATQIFGLFSPLPFLGKMNPIWRAYFSKGLVQPPIRWVWTIFVLTTSGGEWIGEVDFWRISEGLDQPFVDLIILDGNATSQTACVCLGVMPLSMPSQHSNGGVWLQEGFSLTSIECSKTIMFKHTHTHSWDDFFAKNWSLSTPPPPKKKTYTPGKKTYPIPRHFWRWFSFSPGWIC